MVMTRRARTPDIGATGAVIEAAPAPYVAETPDIQPDEMLAGRIFERDAEGRPIAEFGNDRIVKMPRSVINILPQIRRQFDVEKLQELSDSMPLDDSVERLVHELMEPVVEGVHTEASARLYLEQFNKANGTHFTLDSLTPHHTPDGVRYVIHIAGERRIRAVDLLIEKHGYSPESLPLCSVHEDISYADALPLQFIENNARVNPPPADEARAIRGYIAMMREANPRYTQKDCAAKFAVKPEKVHDALVFTDYPQSMQNLVDHYPYNWVVGAEAIYRTWLDYYAQYSSSLEVQVAHVRDRAGLLSIPEQDKPTEIVTENGSPAFFTSDGQVFFTNPQDAATHEVVTCFEMIKAESLARRASQHGLRKKRDVSFQRLLEEARALIRQEAAGIGQDDLIDDQEAYRQELSEKFERDYNNGGEEQLVLFTYDKRRKIAAASLFEAVMNALWTLHAMGDLPKNAPARLGKYAAMPVVPAEADELLFKELAEVSAS